MRIAIAGIVHETNTYCKEQTELSAYQLLRREPRNILHDTHTHVGGCAPLFTFLVFYLS